GPLCRPGDCPGSAPFFSTCPAVRPRQKRWRWIPGPGNHSLSCDAAPIFPKAAGPPASKCFLPAPATDRFPPESLRQNCPDVHLVQPLCGCFGSCFWFLSFCMLLLFCWTEGAAGLPTNTS